MSTKSSANNSTSNRSNGASAHTNNTFESYEKLDINEKELKNNGSLENVGTEINQEKSELNESEDLKKISTEPSPVKTTTKPGVKQPIKPRISQKYTPPKKNPKLIKKPIKTNENINASETNHEDPSQLFRNITDASSLKSQELEPSGVNLAKDTNEKITNLNKEEIPSQQKKFTPQQSQSKPHAKEQNKNTNKSPLRNPTKLSTSSIKKAIKPKESTNPDDDEMKSRNNQSSFARNPTGTYSDQHNSTAPKSQKQPQNPMIDPKTGMPLNYGYPPYGFPPNMGLYQYNHHLYNPYNYANDRNSNKNPNNIDDSRALAYHMSMYHMNVMPPYLHEQYNNNLPHELPYYFGQANSSYFYKWRTTEESTEKQKKAAIKNLQESENKPKQAQNPRGKSPTELPALVKKEANKKIGRNESFQSQRRNNTKSRDVIEKIEELPDLDKKSPRRNSKFPSGGSNLQKSSTFRSTKSVGRLSKNSAADQYKSQLNSSVLSGSLTDDLTNLSKEDIKDLNYSNNDNNNSKRMTGLAAK